jgi:hypothetical protein
MTAAVFKELAVWSVAAHRSGSSTANFSYFRQSPVYSSRGVLHTNTNPSVTNSNNMRFVCPICGKKISTKGNLKVHLETHRPKGKYGCDICGRVWVLLYPYLWQNRLWNFTLPCVMADAGNLYLGYSMKNQQNSQPLHKSVWKLQRN